MTATQHTTLSPLAIIMFTVAVVGTLLAVPHVVVASAEGWPPQFMTLHAVAVVGFWGAGFHYRAHPPRAAEPVEQSAAEKEINELERRLRNTDR